MHSPDPADRPHPALLPTALLTLAALCAFSANSLLCRLALRPADGDAPGIDAVSFTLVRIAAGALVLWPLVARRPAPFRSAPGWRLRWTAPALLFAYALSFALAYRSVDAATGALLLFGAVQLTMLAGGWRAGERPGALRLTGMLLALGGLALLLAPGRQPVDPLGAVLMLLAGAAWGGYSLLGRGRADPVQHTARNFLLALPLALLAALAVAPALHASWQGLALAAASGAVASGLGYVVWYAALRGLSASAAAVVQLAVPPLTALAAVPLLGEAPGARLAVATVVVLAGVAMALLAPTRHRSRRPEA